MDGAGGLIGTNYLGEIAPKDGTMLGYFTGTAWRYANEPERFRVDFNTYEFVAYQPGTTIFFSCAPTCRPDQAATDIVKAQGLVAGGLGADKAKDLLIRLTLDMLGVPYRYVTGYRSSSAARLALQRGEINFYSESPPGYRAAVEPTLVKKAQAIGLVRRRGRRAASRRGRSRVSPSRRSRNSTGSQRSNAVRPVLGRLSHLLASTPP